MPETKKQVRSRLLAMDPNARVVLTLPDGVVVEGTPRKVAEWFGPGYSIQWTSVEPKDAD